MKKTGKRLDGGGRSLSEQKQRVLRCRLETFKHLRSSSLDEIVHKLGNNYRDYHRIKLQSFTKFVQQTLDSPSFKQSKTLIHVSDLEEDEEEENGASEEKIRELFSKAYRTAPSIVFIDEIDAIASKRESLQRETERRIVTQLMTCMDESRGLVQPADANSNSGSFNTKSGYVLVIGATNRPDAVDHALRRPGRFDREIVLGVPDENVRARILSVLTHKLRLEGSFDLLKIARSTPGFVGADLAALADRAGNIAMKRIIHKRKTDMSIDSMNEECNEEWWRQPWSPEEMGKEAVQVVQPSSKREGFSAIPNVKWEDVGELDLLRQEFDRYMVRRVKYPENYEEFGGDLETGFFALWASRMW